MITTITGSNDFLRGITLKKQVDDFIKQHGSMAVERIDGEVVSFEQISNAVQSLPFLSSKKLVVLIAPSQQKQFIQRIDNLLNGVSGAVDLIIVEPKLDKRGGYYKLLKQKTDFHEFNDLTNVGLASWAINYVRSRGGIISQVDANWLVERVGINQQLLKNELDKLLLYSPGIKRQAIELLIDKTPQSSIFELIDAALRGNRAEVIRLYDEQRSLKVEPAQIISILAWQLHVLAVIKTASTQTAESIAGGSHLNPFVVRKGLSLSKRLSFEQLKTMVTDALSLDVKLKTQNIDADEALMYYLLNLSV